MEVSAVVKTNTAIILCGGRGTRLAPVVSDRPKSMASIGSKPFLEILVEGLLAQGVTRFVLATGHLRGDIETHFGSSFLGATIEYSPELTPLGTGGAIKQASKRAKQYPLLICNGDSWVDFSMADLEAEYQKTEKPVILLRHVEDTARFGRVEVVDGSVESFGEKSMSGPGFINAGVYLLDQETLGKLPSSQSFSFESDFLQERMTELGFRAVIAGGRFIDIGTPEDYLKAQDQLS